MPRTDQDIDADRYQITPRTLVFIFNSNDQVLLLRGAENKRLWAGLYNGIGGHVEAGEDILESALRELTEETGIRSAHLHFCGQIMIDITPEKGVGVFLFRGMYAGMSLQPSHEGQLHWINLDEIERYSLVEDLPLLIPKIAAFKPGAPPIIGNYTYGPDGELQISIR